MMGRPKKVIAEADPDLKGLDAVQYSVAQILQERCGINGCSPKFHLDEAGIIVKKMKQFDLIKDSE